MFDQIAQSIPYQKLKINAPVEVTIKRLDLVHPQISGNKFFKLKYNFLEAQKSGLDKIITFGGAYSNHIAATAFAAQQFGFQSVGIIRGEELKEKPFNTTLKTAEQFGMQLHFVSRENYRLKDTSDFLDKLNADYPASYVIPEGGTNALAIQGCKEILTQEDQQNYDVICCAVGTGGTITGLIQACAAHQSVLGFSALKGDFLNKQVAEWTIQHNWTILDDYCFGGYAKTQPVLIQFMKSFEQQYQIPLEQVYTGKMLFGIFDLIQKNYFPAKSKILVIHSGGLQGRNSITE
ncbi:1-aminocyclopropane-1-carboxylate deaminase/D-cysteine desulfhydrase [Acinetobacter sp. ANC 3832]|uniref:1-aminocyclopropane-1-carboxylate deaminase/D-cysteine desulfhydrase n=1 Tax=Acinetobacter sp. ANC 3832 TaxID=1977874 RepID=UPI000A35569E|nr:pyridoxal-phosphate dependent enzyme [Acinetobacter sp. ANC 3832]OTG93131.1 1-aminocyclopropane-1-carboxylate deaminase [Acinetobacter sp. ANC 3832]